MPHPKVKLSDNTGNEVSVTGNRLDVNAYLAATPTIDIGDVSLLLGGTAASVNNGAADATTLRVTIASDTTGVLSVDDNGSTLSIDDGGGAITVDGTVTANLSSTDNTVLDNILTKNTEIDAVLDTIKVDTEAIETAVELLDNAIDGTEMQVDIVSSATLSVNSHAVTNAGTFAVQSTLQAGSAAIGKLAANSGVDIGDVDVTSLPASTNTLEVVGDAAENAAVAGNPVLVGGRYDSSPRSLGDGDVGALAITGKGYAIVSLIGDAGTALDTLADAVYADDGDFTINSDKGMLVMGLQSTGHNISSGDVGAITVDEKGQVRTVTNMGELDTTPMIDVDNAVETLSSNTGTFTDCIEMILQADESNSGYIMIGDTDVGDNRGVKLNAGDTFILTTQDTRLVYLWGSAADQNLRCMLMRSDK